MATLRGLKDEAWDHDTTTATNNSCEVDDPPHLSSRMEIGTSGVLENISPQEVVINHGA